MPSATASAKAPRPDTPTTTGGTLDNMILSPAATVLEMVVDIISGPKKDVHDRLDELRELSTERISFDSPEQAEEIISNLAHIISTDTNPEIRAAALGAMERMIDLERKAEMEQGKPSIDWEKINIILKKAHEQTELDVAPVASRFGPPSPETASPQPDAKVAQPMPARTSSPQAVPPKRGAKADALPPEDKAVLAAQEKAVAALKQSGAAEPTAPPPSAIDFAMPDTGAPPLASEAIAMAGPAIAATGVPQGTAVAPKHLETFAADVPQPTNGKKPSLEQKPEPPIMKFLRSVADTDDEEHIRELAQRVVKKIENLTAQKPSLPQAPALTEG